MAGGVAPDRKEFRVTSTTVGLVVSCILCIFLLLQVSGLLPSLTSSDGERGKEVWRAMDEIKSLAIQTPWQELGQCTADLEALRRKLHNSGDDGVLSEARKCPKCKGGEGSECPPCPSGGTDLRADCPICKPGKTIIKINKFADADLLRADPSGVLKKTQEDLAVLNTKYQDLQQAYERLNYEKSKIDSMEKGGAVGAQQVTSEALEAAKKAIEACSKPTTSTAANLNPSGCTCEATVEELTQYFNYTVRELCPDDWFFVQNLIFLKHCYNLPKRRCLARTPPDDAGRIGFPASLWDQGALDDRNVRWNSNYCKSFECLNTRMIGDCRNCFNLSLEKNRWKSMYRGNMKMADVVALKKGTLRIGLDAGGGTGSFAAHMAAYNITILTTAFNVETVADRMQGMPYMETIALRGLVPLHVPHQARLPFFDNTLDVIHSVNSIKYLELIEFEELLMEWDRVLRPGGILWFEMFYTPVSETPLYISIIDVLGYNRLYWNLTPKPDPGEREGDHLYLNCIIEKPVREG
eukprot:TRINITY_DN1471_c0_g1_i1.p1 TRINITY_DN1471_c0_g1~~TRINITY_DN1471_c0_g1_i1.p1  ORF type:complete len:523 (+),score=75.16 TRINITY_DN1471_c0_g1_i1:109-1677(+)